MVGPTSHSKHLTDVANIEPIVLSLQAHGVPIDLPTTQVCGLTSKAQHLPIPGDHANVKERVTEVIASLSTNQVDGLSCLLLLFCCDNRVLPA
jgi:hypothetical protein